MQRRIKVLLLVIAATLAFEAGRCTSRRRPEPSVESHEPSVRPPVEISEINIPPEELPKANFLKLFHSIQGTSEARREGYLKEIMVMTHNGKRRSALLTFFRCLASADTDSALRLLREITDPEDALQSTGAVLAGAPVTFTPKLVAMLMERAGEVGDRCREKYLDGQFSWWSSFDPVSAAQFVDQHSSRVPDSGKGQVLAGLAEFDPAAAFNWLQQYPELQQNPEVINLLVWGLYHNDPAAARAYVTSNVADERFEKALRLVAYLSFFDSPEIAKEFVDEIPTSETRHVVIYCIAGTDIEMVADGKSEFTRLYERYGNRIMTFSHEDWGGALTPLMTRWIKYDPNGLLDWLSGLPKTGLPDVLEEYCTTLTTEDLAAVFAVKDNALRGEILKVYSKQLGTDIDERTERIRGMNLPEAQTQDLLRIAQDPAEGYTQP